ncbi:hypothetical protein BofuT4_P120180.1 [Botrytis cinerea T4]|uniref:Uncharacterized protein n=1 Tax=Botryotinia fuckeliana (strain T4) TaxID=999810 RepID=G2XXX5_BOTF4|nr:hypothetical protein BofuT4_P120180.1 [Botrytis cinerea T4]
MKSLILMQSVNRLFTRRNQPSNMHDNVMSYELKIRKRGPRELELQHMSELAKYYHGTVCMLNNCDHHGYSANMESFLAATFNDKMNELLFSLKSIFPRNQLFPGTLVDGPRNLSNCLGGLNGRMKTDFWANKTSKLTNVELLRFMTRWVEKEALFLYFDWQDVERNNGGRGTSGDQSGGFALGQKTLIHSFDDLNGVESSVTL